MLNKIYYFRGIRYCNKLVSLTDFDIYEFLFIMNLESIVDIISVNCGIIVVQTWKTKYN